jgi:predicted MFS family arabinose efflux permease
LSTCIAALPHGAYFGAAGLLAASIIGPGSQARGFAAVLGGLTAANVFGVPLITRVGQAAGWRVAYFAIAAMFAATLAFVALTVPVGARRPGRLTARRAARPPPPPGLAGRGHRGRRFRRLLRRSPEGPSRPPRKDWTG